MGNEPKRIPPTDAPADAIERITRRKHLQLVPGDVVVSREQVPRVNTNPISLETQWRYRVSIHTDPWGESQVFFGFVHAAAAAEQLGTELKTRVMYLEDDVPSLLADYRPHT
jgi:hypothetical protein